MAGRYRCMALDDMLHRCLGVPEGTIDLGLGNEPIALCKRHLPARVTGIFATAVPNIVQVWASGSWKKDGFLAFLSEPEEAS
jgi:hypothetical protein